MLSYRKFKSEDDYQIMRQILRSNCKKSGHLKPQLHIGNLDFERFAIEESPEVVYYSVLLVFSKDIPIGFITIDNPMFYIDLLNEYSSCCGEILKYIEPSLFKKGTTVSTEVNSLDSELISFLKQEGYKETDQTRFSGICHLDTIPESQPLPPGYTIRLIEKKDLLRRVELFGLATGGIETTVERYSRLMTSPSYKNAIDMVVEYNGSEIIGYCTLWNDPHSGTSIIEPIACVEEHRKKGLMKNTLLYGMNLIKDRGTQYMYVGTDGGNMPAISLYKSVGFKGYGKDIEWNKILA